MCVHVIQKVAAHLGWGTEDEEDAELDAKDEYSPENTIANYRRSSVEQATTCEATITSLLSRHLNIRPEQASSLLGTEGRHLNNILMHGIEDSFQPVIHLITSMLELNSDFISEIKSCSPFLVQVLESFTVGLISTSRTVSLFILELLSSLTIGEPTVECIWSWFLQSGLQHLMQAIDLYPDMKKGVVAYIVDFAQERLHEVVGPVLMSYLNSECAYLELLHMVLLHVHTKAVQRSSEILLPTAFLHLIVDVGCRNTLSAHESYVRSTAVSMLADLWISFPTQVVFAGASAIFTALKNGFRDSDMQVAIASIASAFAIVRALSMIQGVAESKKLERWADKIFKASLFVVIEDDVHSFRREFAVNNMIELFSQSKGWSLKTFVEPIVRSISSRGAHTCDLHLLFALASHDTLENEDAHLLLQAVLPITLYDESLCQIAREIVVLLLKRYPTCSKLITLTQEWSQQTLNKDWRKGCEGFEDALLVHILSEIIQVGNKAINDHLKTIVAQRVVETPSSLLPLLPIALKLKLSVVQNVRQKNVDKVERNIEPAKKVNVGRMERNSQARRKEQENMSKKLERNYFESKGNVLEYEIGLKKLSPHKRVRAQIHHIQQQVQDKILNEVQMESNKIQREAHSRATYKKKAMIEIATRKTQHDEPNVDVSLFLKSIKKHQHKLKSYFKRYTSIDVYHPSSFEDRGMDIMGITGWIKFVHDFQLVPQWIKDDANAKQVFFRHASPHVDFYTFLSILHSILVLQHGEEGYNDIKCFLSHLNTEDPKNTSRLQTFEKSKSSFTTTKTAPPSCFYKSPPRLLAPRETHESLKARAAREEERARIATDTAFERRRKFIQTKIIKNKEELPEKKRSGERLQAARDFRKKAVISPRSPTEKRPRKISPRRNEYDKSIRQRVQSTKPRDNSTVRNHDNTRNDDRNDENSTRQRVDSTDRIHAPSNDVYSTRQRTDNSTAGNDVYSTRNGDRNRMNSTRESDNSPRSNESSTRQYDHSPRSTEKTVRRHENSRDTYRSDESSTRERDHSTRERERSRTVEKIPSITNSPSKPKAMPPPHHPHSPRRYQREISYDRYREMNLQNENKLYGNDQRSSPRKKRRDPRNRPANMKPKHTLVSNSGPVRKQESPRKQNLISPRQSNAKSPRQSKAETPRRPSKRQELAMRAYERRREGSSRSRGSSDNSLYDI